MRTFLRVPALMVAMGVVVTLPAVVHAQVTEVSRASVAEMAKVTFGYRCDDRFVIRNDGDTPVSLAYAVEKSNEHTTITLAAHELVELNSPSKRAMELWMDGKLVAKAGKDKRSCKDVQGNASIAVAPLVVDETDDTRNNRSFGARGYPFYDPFFYGGLYGGYYNGFGFSPFYRGYLGSPIVITTIRGGVRGGRRGR